jgi:hypothetical protein
MKARADGPRKGEPRVTKTLHGRVHGKTIQLQEDPGVAEGQQVEIELKVISEPIRVQGDGFKLTEGALKDDPYWDEIMKEIHEERKREVRTETNE